MLLALLLACGGRIEAPPDINEGCDVEDTGACSSRLDCVVREEDSDVPECSLPCAEDDDCPAGIVCHTMWGTMDAWFYAQDGYCTYSIDVGCR